MIADTTLYSSSYDDRGMLSHLLHSPTGIVQEQAQLYTATVIQTSFGML